MGNKPSKKEIEDAERELDSLGKGGKGSGDLAARMLAQHRDDVDAEPLNTNPEPKDER